MSKDVLVYAEHRDGELKRAGLEALSEGRRLADALGGSLGAVVVGSGVAGLAAELGCYGADRVHVFDDAGLANYATEPTARAVADVAKQSAPAALLISMTAMGKDLAPRVAARLDAGLVSDCQSLELKDGRLTARRAMYSGKAIATCSWESELQIATLRPNVFPLAEPDASRQCEVVDGKVDASARARVTRVEASSGGKIELTEAQIIVSGGRGLKGPENFHLVEELASALGGAVGASRAVVDAGWKDHQYQVGQTGKTVSPTLYVACAISGAIQHLAGMSSSRVIVAINKDPDAPIFKVANYGILGDVFEVLPKLTEEAKAHFAANS